MKKLIILIGVVFLLGCNKDDDPGQSEFSCIAPPEGATSTSMINLAVYQTLVNKNGYLSPITNTFIKINGAWSEMTHWTWFGFAEDAQITAFKFNIGTKEYLIEKDHFVFNQLTFKDFEKDNYTFNVLMDNQSEEVTDADLYLSIWRHDGECNDVIVINE